VYAEPQPGELVTGARAEAIAMIGHQLRVIGTGIVRSHTVAITFLRLTRGNYTIELLETRARRQPLVIGHTALVIS
jgi:hypothetical protein